MRRFAVLLLLSIPVYACAAAPASGPEAEAAVTAVLDKFYGAMKTGDTVTAMSVIAPDALFVEWGQLETRASMRRITCLLDIDFEKQVTGKRGPLRITVQGDTAWVIAVTEFDGTFQGAPINLTGAQLAVLTRETGDWLIRSIHWSSHRR